MSRLLVIVVMLWVMLKFFGMLCWMSRFSSEKLSVLSRRVSVYVVMLCRMMLMF